MSDFVFNTVSADVLAPFGAKAFADTLIMLMTDDQVWVLYMRWHLVGQDNFPVWWYPDERLMARSPMCCSCIWHQTWSSLCLQVPWHQIGARTFAGTVLTAEQNTLSSTFALLLASGFFCNHLLCLTMQMMSISKGRHEWLIWYKLAVLPG